MKCWIVAGLAAACAWGQQHTIDPRTAWLKGDFALAVSELAAISQSAVASRMAGEFEIERGNFPLAAALLKEAKARAYGDTGVWAERRRAGLACVMGDYATAQKIALDHIKWDGRTVAKLKVTSPILLNVLGEIYLRRGSHDLATDLFERSIREAGKAWSHERVIARLGIARARLQAGDLAAAHSAAAEAHEQARLEWGEFSIPALDAKDTLALVLLARGDLDQAETLVSVAAATRENLYGAVHLKVGESYLHVARVLAAKHDMANALKAADHAVEIHQQVLPRPNARVAAIIAESADVYEAAGQATEARKRREAAGRLVALYFGDDAPMVRALARTLEKAPSVN